MNRNRIAFMNSKGGCGKTMTVFQVAGELSQRGYKVLVMDLDKQMNATNVLLINNSQRTDTTVLDYLLGNASFNDTIQKAYFIPKGKRNPVPSNVDVMASDLALYDQSKVAKLNRKSILERIEDDFEDYDYVLIDCPPQNEKVESLVMEVLANKVIIPMSSDIDSIDGINQLINTIDDARDINEIDVFGIYLSLYDKGMGLHKEVREIMAANFDLFIDVQLPFCSAMADSRASGRPVCECPKSNADDAIKALTDEIIERL